MEALWILALALVIVVAVILVRSQVRVVTVHDYERGLRFRRGRLEGIVGSGTYVVARALGEIRLLDARPVTLAVEGQEVLTSDGVAAKVSLVARYVVADAVTAVTGDADFRRALYLQLQLALRDAIGRRTLEQAIADRRALGAEIRAGAGDWMASVGVEILAAEVRDVMLPGELKRAFASVIAARRNGEAALERVRAETASLRALANAGRLVEDSPGLLQLRVLQELGEGSGHTVVFGAPELPAVPRGGRASAQNGRRKAPTAEATPAAPATGDSRSTEVRPGAEPPPGSGAPGAPR